MEKSSVLKDPKASEVSKKETFSFGLGYAALNLGQIGIFGYLTFFWSDIALIPLAAISMIYLIPRLWDWADDIFVGYLVDLTHTKYGKARPWLLWSLFPTLITLILLFYVPDISTNFKIIYAFVIYSLVNLFYLTAFQIPMQTLDVLITNDRNTRLSLNMFGQLFGTATYAIASFFVPMGIAFFGGGEQGYFYIFGLLSVITAICIFITFKGVKERTNENIDQPDKKDRLKIKEAVIMLITNKYWLINTLLQFTSWLVPSFMAVSLYYVTWIMKEPNLQGTFMSTMMVAGLVMLLICTPFVKKIGKSITAYSAMMLQFVGALVTLINPASVALLLVSASLRGAGSSVMLGTRLAFTSDAVEYGEWKTGKRTEGLIFSATSIGQRLGQGIGGALVTWILATGGYVGGAEAQTASAISAINLLFTWLCAIGSLGAIICLMIMQRLDKKMPIIMADLEERRRLNQ
ncbi:MAG: MFS transporter [Eubacteriales bacterium]